MELAKPVLSSVEAVAPIAEGDLGVQKIYVLDTNVLLHDPTAVYAFNEHKVILPMTVLEELDETRLFSRTRSYHRYRVGERCSWRAFCARAGSG